MYELYHLGNRIIASNARRIVNLEDRHCDNSLYHTLIPTSTSCLIRSIGARRLDSFTPDR
jgi:hypothetical protein